MKNKTLKKKKVIDLYGVWHLGDAIFIMIYLYNCKDYIQKNNIRVNFYIKEKHVKQIKEFICCKNVKVIPILFKKKCISEKIFGKKIPVLRDFNDLFIDQKLCDTNIPAHAVNTFHGFDCVLNYFLLGLNMFKHVNHKRPYNEYLAEYLSKVLGKKIGFPKIKDLIYTDYDLITRHEKLPEKYKNLDILIINSEPQSYQYDLENNREEFNKMIYTLSEKYKVEFIKQLRPVQYRFKNDLKNKRFGTF
jgi:hypothetical protein